MTALGNGHGGSVSTVEVRKSVVVEVEDGVGVAVGEKGMGNETVGHDLGIMADPDAIESAALKSKDV